MQGKSLSVNKVPVRLKEVYLPREAPTYWNGRIETHSIESVND